MKVPSSLLEKYVKLTKSPDEIAELLTIAGLEVDRIDFCNLPFEGVIIAHVEEVHPHPKADKLQIAYVHDGKDQHKVICGASNCVAGINVAFAKIGAKLTLPTGDTLAITKRDLRGITSYGMLCSESELGISKKSDGIMILSNNAPIGEDFKSYITDPTFDISLTPNLGFCRSILGVAREIGMQLSIPVETPNIKIKEAADLPIKGRIQVTNETESQCMQYTCRLIQGVELGPSPEWLSLALHKSGIKSINNIVDVTNYVMHLLGQPLHAFDYDKIESNHIRIKLSDGSESLTTLDHVERSLPKDSIIIYDNLTPIAIGGIMGGLSTAISNSTHTVLLEAAQFCHASIRKTSKKLNLRTEASSRFEYEVDPNGVVLALDFAAELISQVAGGRVCKGHVEDSPLPYRPRFLSCRVSKANKTLGTTFSLSETEALFDRMQIIASSDGEDTFQIKVPSHRNDIQGEIDIIEELGRCYGYNNITRPIPKHISSHVTHNPLYLLETKLRARLVSLGLQEFLTCSLISPKLCDIEIEHGLFAKSQISVMHAKSEDQSILRPSLLPGLLSSLKLNQNHGLFTIKAFEIGRIQFKTDTGYDENSALGIILSGKRQPYHFENKPDDVDFFDLKGLLENICEALLLKDVSFERGSFSTFHPGRQSYLHIGNAIFGVFGEIHPNTIHSLDIRNKVYFAEIDLTILQRLLPGTALFTELPQFPSSERDVTISMKKKTPMKTLFDAIEKLSSPLLKDSKLIDIYTGESAGANKMNVTLRFTYRNDTRTLEDEEIQIEHEKVVKAINKAV